MDFKLIVILVACLFFCITNRGVHAGNADASSCRASDLVVSTKAEAGPGGRPQHFVSVINTCSCAQKNIKLACPGFNYTIDVYPASAIRRDRDGVHCTLLGGRPVGPARSVSFIYESSATFSFQPVSSTSVC
ncbi:hypothetical protein CFC21_080515 [Triticum aestivum]|uniref:Uncharacterized protein n=3 Tax=Triticinae TaxID=1648030 RepID=A0A453M9J9_AEGTS|nr:uncharacterized protein LOC109784225 [Aegilops tauschii subsp. strangulata]XP_044402366.1 uncharacterized protein LOC123126003 [Triticum aestivum]KAF7075764.1 hypothetical protein CFC21_080515 [Triticum aestivum]